MFGPSNNDPLDLIEGELVAPAIAKLRRAGQTVVHHCRDLFEPELRRIRESASKRARRRRRRVPVESVGDRGELIYGAH
jgi:hypothetical protein